MQTIGHLVQETIDFLNSGFKTRSMTPTAQAIEGTMKKAFAKENLSPDDYKKFLKQNWQLIVFMGMPRALPLPLNVTFGVKRIFPSFNVHQGADDIISLILRETLKNGRMPDGFAFNSEGKFEMKDGKLLLPPGLVNGLLGSVIFNPVNREESIGEKYWMSISDFKMFISELWGRADLAGRIMKFYLERD
jgi:hypothetical protein